MGANLQELIDDTENMMHTLRNMQTGPNVYPVTPEFTNWRDEQWACRTGHVRLRPASLRETSLAR